MKKGLGRGLGALLDRDGDTPAKEPVTQPAGSLMVDIRKIEPNLKQPRVFFDEAALNELAESIKSYGVIQPLIVKDNGDHYSIIAGERRFRAARIAKLEAVPVIVKDYSELDILQIALIENIQRQDLTPIEEATCYKRLIEDFFFSAEDVAQKVGKNKHNVNNMLILLDLDERVQSLAAEGQLTASHGRVLLALKDGDVQFHAAAQIIEKALSVRQAEVLVAGLLKNGPHEEEKLPEDVIAAYRREEDNLKRLLGSKVYIKPGKKRGRIEIEYYSPDELDRLLGLLKCVPTTPTEHLL